MSAASQPPSQLQPDEGAINTIVAEKPVRDIDDATTQGRATLLAAAHLARDVGAAVLSLAMEHKGTLELQLTVEKERDALAGVTTHKWRVDVWKARQRQYLRVMVAKIDLIECAKPDVDLPPSTLPDGTKLGMYHCPHCGTAGYDLPYSAVKLPRRKSLTCGKCTLPVFLQLVEAKSS